MVRVSAPQTVASETATAVALAAAAAATAAAEAATAAAKAVASAASSAATAAASAGTADVARIGRLEMEQNKLSADVALIKQEQTHMREIMTGRFGTIDTFLSVMDGKLDVLKAGSDETKGALTVVRFLGASGLVSGIIAILTMILKFNGVLR